MTNEVKFRRQYDPSYKGSPSKIEFGPSLTEPDLNLSVKQLMERHTRGVGPYVEPKNEYYEEDIGGEIPVIRDFVDIEDYKEELKEKAKSLEAKLQKERDERIAKQKKDAEAARSETTASDHPKTPLKEE